MICESKKDCHNGEDESKYQKCRSKKYILFYV